MTRLFSFLLVMLAVAIAAGAQTPALLPADFAGWQRQGEPRTGADAAAADPANRQVLEEFGFAGFEAATYVRDGRKMQLKAARFADTTGAYGAFTFYKHPGMLSEEIGTQGAFDSNQNNVLFYSGNVLVDVQLDRVTGMTASELRQLAEMMPKAGGPAGNLPTLPGYLPRQGYVPHTAKFVLGPAALERVHAPVSASLVDFSRSPEVVIGRYRTAEGEAALVIISYPTPQIAGERMRAMESQGGFRVKRSGSLVALVSGEVNESLAKSLLGAVNYDATVTWSEATGLGPRDNIGNLLINVFMLAGVLILFALVAGIAFGGLRVLIKRLYPDRVFDRGKDVDIIRLGLGESGQKRP